MPAGKSGITRTRPTLSCMECKRRKIKCDKQQPACNNCKRLKDVCNYNPFPGRGSDPATPSTRQTQHAQYRHQTRSTDDQSGTNSTAQSTPGTSPDAEAVGEQHAWQPSNMNAASLAASTSLAGHNAFTMASPFDGPFHRPSGSTATDSIDPGTDDDFTLMDADAAMSIDGQGVLHQSGIFGHLPTDMDFAFREFDQSHNSSQVFEPQQPTQASTGYLQQWTDHQIGRLLHDPPSPLKQTQMSQESVKLKGIISSPQGGSPRYVGSSFWGLAGNGVTDCGLLLQAQHSAFQARLQDPSRISARSEILMSLPPKWLSDVLVDSFFLGIKPLLPLVHEPTFRSKYESFWDWYTDHRASGDLGDLQENVTFPCLLWSVLFCGAVAATPSSLESCSIRSNNRSAFITRIRSKLDLTLDAYSFLELPTLDGLVGSILVQECDPFVDDIMSSGRFVAQVLQVARTLGLHDEETISTLPEPDAEIARRTWYHVLQLDVLVAIFSGNSPSPASLESSFTTRMPHKYNDASMEAAKSGTATAEPQTSTAMLLAIGRYEMSHIMRRVLDTCFNHSMPNEDELNALIHDMRRFEQRIDVLSEQMEVPLLPQHGHISSQLLKANPRDHAHLYEDDPQAENVLNTFAAISLSMMKDWASTLLNRRFLHQNSDKSSGVWRSQILLSSHFLKNYLHLTALPAFEPYRWCYPSKLQPLQDCMLVLTYLQDNPDTDDAQQLKYLLVEIFDIFRGKDNRQGLESLSLPGIRRYEACWQHLELLRVRVFTDMEKHTPRRSHASSSASSYSEQRTRQQSTGQRSQFSQPKGMAPHSAPRTNIDRQQTGAAGTQHQKPNGLRSVPLPSPSVTERSDFFGPTHRLQDRQEMYTSQTQSTEGEDWADLIEM